MTRRAIIVVAASMMLASAACAADSQIWGGMIITNIPEYGKDQSRNLGPLFTYLQGNFFRSIFLGILLGIPAVFLCHYLVFGPKVFSHDGERIYVFTLFNRIIHLLAAVSFVILVPTGFMIVFGAYLGGGALVTYARHLHGIATIVFAVSVVPMFVFWFVEMLPAMDDIKWFFMLGGYLSRKKQEVPAGKFNGGQKVWFWLATIGGLVMIVTGGAMYLQDFGLGIAGGLGMSQIDLLRLAAIVHNLLAFAVVAFFFTHVYMSLFAIKGSINSIITGYKEEDEVKHLHSSYYRKLKQVRKA
ncbi:formate dehydrogenase subunit gamma [Desulfofustis glycolicus]|uniref:Formate dehydrogenase gamma subunit n=1 Tax=Desulfofustis glycolicus DSM 9705 TaxID=1121409 RepID=A0A1M5SMZ5_9BACT|nr:formate dehydrogenase subunit gamma [Desulfofustis glycolicus]MCB2215633.1 formate dehydrogenase subunit gamma [Desulfobulbaceae bacterium]SHH39830.1 formate dehydrogenase gamma subunit [Desulfofustis glycolicus DSM 9705]